MKIVVTASKEGAQKSDRTIELPSVIATLELSPLPNLTLDAANLDPLKKHLESIVLNYCVDAGVAVTVNLTVSDN